MSTTAQGITDRSNTGSTKSDDPLWTTRLSAMDMRMNAYSFRALYVFPSGGSSNGSCDLKAETKSHSIDRLEQSFAQLLRDDYPFLIDGEMHVDQVLALLLVA